MGPGSGATPHRDRWESVEGRGDRRVRGRDNMNMTWVNYGGRGRGVIPHRDRWEREIGRLGGGIYNNWLVDNIHVAAEHLNTRYK